MSATDTVGSFEMKNSGPLKLSKVHHGVMVHAEIVHARWLQCVFNHRQKRQAKEELWRIVPIVHS